MAGSNNKKTKGAFGKCKTKIEHKEENGKKFIVVSRRRRCFKCGRMSKDTKKNFPTSVVIEKKKVGKLCRVCVRNFFKKKEKKRLEKEAAERLLKKE